MLDLNSERWATLHQAYGTAENIPALLRQLDPYPPPERIRSRVWGELSGCLCHQGTVATASLAAFPHLLRICRSAPEHLRHELLGFMVYIEAGRVRQRLELPADLAGWYHDAIQALPAVVVSCLGVPWSDEQARVFAATFAVAKGQPRLGITILELNRDYVCNECSTPLFYW